MSAETRCVIGWVLESIRFGGAQRAADGTNRGGGESELGAVLDAAASI
jgi:hypothetical protein